MCTLFALAIDAFFRILTIALTIPGKFFLNLSKLRTLISDVA